MATLFQISNDLQALLDLVNESEGEILPEFSSILENWMQEIAGKESEKLEGYCCVIKELTARMDARKNEVRRLQKLVEIDGNHIDRLRERLQLHMEMTGQKRISTRLHQIVLCANGGLLPVHVVCEASTLPYEYQIVQIDADRKALREALQDGKEIPGVSLGQRGNHVRIS
jgi:hypothetical protein